MSKHTHSILIDHLGGTVAVARAASGQAGESLRPQSVTQWRKRGIAHSWRPTIAEMARAKNIDVPDGFLLPPGRKRDESHADERAAASGS